jgi:peptidoglycan/LPS O-acetylase OafA/YrhL
MRLAWLLAIAVMLAFPYLHTVIGPLATLLVAGSFSAVLLASHGEADVAPWRHARMIKTFGEFSFSLYIIHLPLIYFLLTVPVGSPKPSKHLPQFSLAAAGLMALLVGASYCAAFLFAQLTERHTSWLRERLMVALRRFGSPGAAVA